MPDSVRKITKKYLTTDFVTINVAANSAQESPANDEDDVRLHMKILLISEVLFRTQRNLLLLSQTKNPKLLLLVYHFCQNRR